MRFLYISIILILGLNGCSGDSESDIREAIEAKDLSKVKELVNQGEFSIFDSPHKDENLIQYAAKNQQFDIADYIANSSVTQRDIKSIVESSLSTCMKSANDDTPDYCNCTLTKIYSQVSYNDFYKNTSNFNEVAVVSGKSCL